VGRRFSKRGKGRARVVSAQTGPVAKSGLRPMLGLASVQAALIFLVLLVAYLANGDVLAGNDATANVRLAGKLVTQRQLVFTPEAEPFLFEWRLKTPAGERYATFRSWQNLINGESIRRWYERGDLSKPDPRYFLIRTRQPGVYANRYGLGTGLFAVPFVAAVYPFARDLYQAPSAGVLWYATKVAACCAVAGSAVLLFLAALPFLRRGTAIWLALAYGLGTCAWSTSSQALWQHGPTEFFLALGTFFLMRQDRPRSAYWVGCSYALAFACRPTAALAGIAAAIYYLVRDRRAFLRCLVGAAPPALLLVAYNLHFFGKAMAFGQLGEVVAAVLQIPVEAMVGTAWAASTSDYFHTSLLRGIGGSLISPSRGLLVFSPVVIFVFWGLVRVWRDRRFSALRPVGLAALLMCLVVARWHGWWGGWCYGYRLLMDSVTLMAFLAIPVAEEIRGSRVLAAVFGVCLAWSVAVQFVGAFAYDVTEWNNRTLFVVNRPGEAAPLLFLDPTEARREAWARGGSVEEQKFDVNSGPGHKRLWSIRDSQILYYFEHFFESRRTKQLATEGFLRGSG
jgi:hypothetical protein